MNNPTIGGSNINETFTISNSGLNDGSESVYWTAYISTDTTFDDPGDTPIDSGQITALNSSQVSASISIDNGSWPSVGETTSYYLFVDVSSSDELPANVGNNTDYATFSITVPDIDYQVISITNANTPADISSAISETFSYQNSGADNGTSDVIWTAYISADQNFDGSDTIIDSGTAGALTSGATSGAVAITSTWTATAGIYYIFVTLSSADETNISNNNNLSGLFTITAPSDLDYIVTSVSSDYLTVTTGSPVSETFSFTNAGGIAGVSVVNWEAFVSSDQFWDGGDELIGTGTVSALAAGSSSVGNSIDATWTSTPGVYYLIMKLNAADETIIDNNEYYSGSFTVNVPPDYIITNILMPLEQYGGNINDNLNLADGAHSFCITENAGNNGNQTISWAVYLSNDASLDGSDTIADSGTISPLSASATSAVISVDFNLPASPGYYYYIIQITAGDDSNNGNNSYTTSEISIWQNTGNIEIDESEDDGFLSNAEDYSVILNPADTINITGRIDTIVSYRDLFLISTGPSTTVVDISVSWLNTNVDLDIYAFSSDATNIGSSIDVSSTVEPSAGVFTLSGLATNSDYYIMISVYDFSNPITSGNDYNLIITGQ